MVLKNYNDFFWCKMWMFAFWVLDDKWRPRSALKVMGEWERLQCPSIHPSIHGLLCICTCHKHTTITFNHHYTLWNVKTRTHTHIIDLLHRKRFDLKRELNIRFTTLWNLKTTYRQNQSLHQEDLIDCLLNPSWCFLHQSLMPAKDTCHLDMAFLDK